MKPLKLLCVCLCCMILCSCGTNMGKFEDGTMDLEKLFHNINQKSIEGEWEFPILQQEAMPLNEVSKWYGFDMTKMKECVVHTAILQPEIAEIAFLHVDETYDKQIQQGIEERLERLTLQWQDCILDAKDKIQQRKEGRIGEYYYVIVGSDAQKVVNYIQNMK